MSDAPRKLGYSWLIEHYGLHPIIPLQSRAEVGTTNRSYDFEDGRVDNYTKQYAPEVDSLKTHLTFALKREDVNLEILASLFQVIDIEELKAWIVEEPTGQYSRMACFIYEWLTDTKIDYPDVTSGTYVDFLDPDKYLVNTMPLNNRRWRVRDNLPGSWLYCPMIKLTPRIKEIEQYDIRSAFDALGAEYGDEILKKSAVWLTIKESKSSFQIEHEGNKVDRIQRFAQAMERYCGAEHNSLNPDFISKLQEEILGPNALFQGFRQSPIFVGENRGGYQQIIHYLAPHWDDCGGMLRGLETTLFRTKGASSILRAAIASFGFVFIHPLVDGNGRVSRFLINDILRRDEAIPAPFILPVSAVMMKASLSPKNYDQVLESFSKPFMRAIEGEVKFGSAVKYPDGIESDVQFEGYSRASFAWRYMDLTEFAVFMYNVVRETIEHEMRQEADLMRSYDLTRTAIKEIIEAPNDVIDRIVRSIVSQKGEVSNKLIREFPILAREEVAADISRAVMTNFQQPTPQVNSK